MKRPLAVTLAAVAVAILAIVAIVVHVNSEPSVSNCARAIVAGIEKGDETTGGTPQQAAMCNSLPIREQLRATQIAQREASQIIQHDEG
jgi:hypothetical protein